ncbi:glycosyl hydrolase [Alteromonas sp. KS69]|nr:glycosyl hydrolase [Alteromonas sp. KS69]
MDKVNYQHEQAMQRTDFYQAFASNDNVAVLVGNSGVVLSSIDGATWERTVLSGQPSFLAVDTCPDQRFIALSFDNHIWVSSPTGDDWVPIKVDSAEQLITIDCAPNGKWWVAGGFSTFLSSSDKGQSWQSNTLEEDAIITDVVFLSEQEAVATAEFGMFVVTEDGGNTWQVSGFMPAEFYPHAAYFTSIAEGWVAGLNGFIYYTKNSGNTWHKQSADSTVPIYQFQEIDGVLFALGDNATVLKLTGDQWKTVQPPSAPVYLRAALYFKQKLLVAGGRGMFITITPNTAALSINNTEL